jgi:hypothetical protein
MKRTSRNLSSTSLRKTHLLLTIPLLNGIGDLDDNETSAHGGAYFDFQRNSVSPAVTPVEILVSKDWKLGVALLRLLRPSNVSTKRAYYFTPPRLHWSSWLSDYANQSTRLTTNRKAWTWELWGALAR